MGRLEALVSHNGGQTRSLSLSPKRAWAKMLSHSEDVEEGRAAGSGKRVVGFLISAKLDDLGGQDFRSPRWSSNVCN